jgi:hypothetical protein
LLLSMFSLFPEHFTDYVNYLSISVVSISLSITLSFHSHDIT